MKFVFWLERWIKQEILVKDCSKAKKFGSYEKMNKEGKAKKKGRSSICWERSLEKVCHHKVIIKGKVISLVIGKWNTATNVAERQSGYEIYSPNLMDSMLLYTNISGLGPHCVTLIVRFDQTYLLPVRLNTGLWL